MVDHYPLINRVRFLVNPALIETSDSGPKMTAQIENFNPNLYGKIGNDLLGFEHLRFSKVD